MRYLDIGLITYGSEIVTNSALDSSSDECIGIDWLFLNPRNLSEVEQDDASPIWIEPKASGLAPMCACFRKAKAILADWIDKNPDSYPPTVLNITDGEPSDGDPRILAEEIKQLKTSDGNVLLFNLHISSCEGESIYFPETSDRLPDEYAKMLFEISSNIPTSLIEIFRHEGYKDISFKSKAFAFNAPIQEFCLAPNLGDRWFP